MLNENSRLKIHTGVRPAPEEPVREEAAPQGNDQNRGQKVKRKGFGRRESPSPGRKRVHSMQEGMTAGEKLLRNTAVACALLLSVMALKNADQPWTRKVTEGVKQAMTMRIDWDETLGRLSFVRSLMPETALVFLNLGDRTDLTAPAQGEITHAYTEQQPWLEYRCEASHQVAAASDGVVTAAGQGAGGDWIVLIQSGEGVETVYGYLESVYVRAGQKVKSGQQIGVTAAQADSRLYFELRENGEPADPTGRMK